MNTGWNPLQGASDLHIHIGPDAIDRYYDSIDLARDAAEHGMAAVVIKDQLCPSMFKAALSHKVVPEVQVFGSIVLNQPCGGISARSVAYALKCGAKIVWMPTVDAEYCYLKGMSGHWIKRVNDRNSFKGNNPCLKIVDEHGRCLPEVIDILKMAADAGAIIASGHISPSECIAALEANAKIGAKFVITHPNLWFDDFNFDNLRLMVEMGAMVEMTSSGLTPNRGHGDIYEMVDMIRQIGYQNCFLSTDAGAIDTPAPPESLRSFCFLLRNCGISEADIEYMAVTNTAKLLGI